MPSFLPEIAGTVRELRDWLRQKTTAVMSSLETAKTATKLPEAKQRAREPEAAQRCNSIDLNVLASADTPSYESNFLPPTKHLRPPRPADAAAAAAATGGVSSETAVVWMEVPRELLAPGPVLTQDCPFVAYYSQAAREAYGIASRRKPPMDVVDSWIRASQKLASFCTTQKKPAGRRQRLAEEWMKAAQRSDDEPWAWVAEQLAAFHYDVWTKENRRWADEARAWAKMGKQWEQLKKEYVTIRL